MNALSRRARENLVAAMLLAVFCGVIWLSLDFGPRARMIPLPLAIFGVALTLIQIVWQNVRAPDELRMDLIRVSDRASPGAAAPIGTEKPVRSELHAYLIVAVLIGLIYALGLIAAVFVFTWGYFLLTRQYSLRAGLGYTVLFTAAVYFLFIVALQIEPYHGLLAPLVERLR
jgi:hypothetical protein